MTTMEKLHRSSGSGAGLPILHCRESSSEVRRPASVSTRSSMSSRIRREAKVVRDQEIEALKNQVLTMARKFWKLEACASAKEKEQDRHCQILVDATNSGVQLSSETLHEMLKSVEECRDMGIARDHAKADLEEMKKIATRELANINRRFNAAVSRGCSIKPSSYQEEESKPVLPILEDTVSQVSSSDIPAASQPLVDDEKVQPVLPILENTASPSVSATMSTEKEQVPSDLPEKDDQVHQDKESAITTPSLTEVSSVMSLAEKCPSAMPGLIQMEDPALPSLTEVSSLSLDEEDILPSRSNLLKNEDQFQIEDPVAQTLAECSPVPILSVLLLDDQIQKNDPALPYVTKISSVMPVPEKVHALRSIEFKNADQFLEKDVVQHQPEKDKKMDHLPVAQDASIPPDKADDKVNILKDNAVMRRKRPKKKKNKDFAKIRSPALKKRERWKLVIPWKNEALRKMEYDLVRCSYWERGALPSGSLEPEAGTARDTRVARDRAPCVNST